MTKITNNNLLIIIVRILWINTFLLNISIIDKYCHINNFFTFYNILSLLIDDLVSTYCIACVENHINVFKNMYNYFIYNLFWKYFILNLSRWLTNFGINCCTYLWLEVFDILKEIHDALKILVWQRENIGSQGLSILSINSCETAL